MLFLWIAREAVLQHPCRDIIGLDLQARINLLIVVSSSRLILAVRSAIRSGFSQWPSRFHSTRMLTSTDCGSYVIMHKPDSKFLVTHFVVVFLVTGETTTDTASLYRVRGHGWCKLDNTVVIAIKYIFGHMDIPIYSQYQILVLVHISFYWHMFETTAASPWEAK